MLLPAPKYASIKPLLDSIPESILKRTDDTFVEAFVDARNHKFDLTLEDFFSRFGEIPRILSEVGITLIEKTADEVIGRRNVSKECAIVQRAAVASRGERKTDSVCRHDVCHYLLVEEERSRRSKAWFLTRDKTLGRAAVELRPRGTPFCFSFVGLLQSVSPFVEAPDAHSSLVDLFTGVLLGEIDDLSGESIFTLDEVKLVSQLHADVLATSPDLLFEAYDYVRNNVLKGKPFRDQDHREIALEIRKYLASTRDKKLKNLENELTSEKRRRTEENEKRERAERTNREKDQTISAKDQKIGEKDQMIDRLQSDAEKREAARLRTEHRLEAGIAALGGFCAMLLWQLDSRIVETIGVPGSSVGAQHLWWLAGVRLLGAVVLVAGVFRAIRRLNLGYQATVVTAIGAVAVLGLDSVSPLPIVGVADYSSVVAPIVLVVLSILRSRPTGGQDGTSAPGP